MKRILFVASMLCFAVPAAARCQEAPDAARLEALLAEFLAGASRNDAAVHDRFWADSLVYTRSTGVRIGKPELMRSVREAKPPAPDAPATVYSAEDVRIQQFGDVAVVAFRLVGLTTARGAPGARRVPQHRHLREARGTLAGRGLAGDAGLAARGRGAGLSVAHGLAPGTPLGARARAGCARAGAGAFALAVRRPRSAASR